MTQVRLLLWLKWKLTIRSLQRGVGPLVGSILAVVFFLPISLLLAIGTYFGLVSVGPTGDEYLLRFILIVVYVCWIVGPLVGLTLNDSYDITRLFTYPISARKALASMTVGSLMDLPVLFLLPVLLGIAAAYGESLVSLAFAAVALVFFLLHTLGLSQVLLMLSQGVMRTRQARDALAVFVPALMLFACFFFQAGIGRMAAGLHVDTILQSPIWRALAWIPPGLAARAISLWSAGHLLEAAGCLTLLGVEALITLFVSAWAVNRIYTGEGTSSPPSVDRGRMLARRAVATNGRRSFLPPVVSAVFAKEIAYIRRDPYFRLLMLTGLYMLGIFAFAILSIRHPHLSAFGPDRGPRAPSTEPFWLAPALAWGFSSFLITQQIQVCSNIFGNEGAASAVLFLFPASRRQILIGKNLAAFATISLANLVAITAISAAAGALAWFPIIYFWMEALLGLEISLGNPISLWFPVRMVMKGWRVRTTSTGQGCLYLFAYAGVLIAVGLAATPVAAALIIPEFFALHEWFVLAIPLTVFYVAGAYLLSLYVTESMMLDREPSIIARLSIEEG